MAYFQLLRPQQWIKNVFVFAALLFGRRLTDLPSLYLALLGFGCFCLLSSAVYVINDIHDRAEDRLHPRKRLRPIASGAIQVPAAVGVALMLVIVGLGGAVLLNPLFAMTAGAYLALQLFYTFLFKHLVVLDVISIGLGFVLRAIAGGPLIGVEISPWLIICTFTLCLFMGFSKRRCELNAMAGANGGEARQHRKTLAVYTPDLLNHMTTVTAGIAVLTFLLYAMDATTFKKFGSYYLAYTLPLVVYAIFRFAVLVEHGEVDGPTDVVLKDRPFQIALTLWVVLAALIVYNGPGLTRFFANLSGVTAS